MIGEEWKGFSQLARVKKLRKRHKACGVANNMGVNTT
jgi:hypothetical protein